MSPRLPFLFSAALPLAVAVACTKPSEQSARLSPDQPATVAPVAPVASPAKPAPLPASTTDSTKGKERRPLQAWGHYLLTD
jgi:hypothetical protein